MATIVLMRYNGIPQVINKTPLVVTTLTGNFKQPYSLMNPGFNFEGATVQNYLNSNAVNYFQIEDKFYYLMDWKIQPNNIIEVRLHLDVLNTFKTEIGKLTVLLDRSSTSPDADLRDNMYPLESGHTVHEVNFPREFSDLEADGTYVMVTSQTGYAFVEVP